MTDRPPTPLPDGCDPQATAWRCVGCRRVIGIVAPGRYWMRHAGRTVLIEGLTEVQRIRVWCESCSTEQEVKAA